MTNADLESLKRAAELWQAGDPDPKTVRALGELAEAGSWMAVRDCFEPPMEFGTAGLRGIVGPGPAQMNQAVIRRVTKALTEVVAARALGQTSAPIVLGFDGRLDSRRFAVDAVGVIAGTGRPVAFFREPVPTPVVAFAGRKLDALASVVITASHNPPEYNGYKVYGPEGIQIVPPFDAEVAARVAVAGAANQIDCESEAFDGGRGTTTLLGDEMLESYVGSVLSDRVEGAKTEPLRVAYSPLHGVGARVFERVFVRAGYTDLHIEPSQREPDGHFTTVRFPNPEEPATLARGLALAEGIAADVLIVNDPDADRMGAALPDKSGKFRILSGNEIGILLTNYLLSHAAEPKDSLVVSTLVSTPMTALIAREYGAHFEQTLTGFKWLWSAVRALEAERGLKFVLCWEEALGYSTHSGVRDKDGIAAGLALADWVSSCRQKGVLPLDCLGELYRRHGAWGSAQLSLVRPSADGLGEIQGMLGRLSERPPSSLLGRRVTSFMDYSRGAEVRPSYCGAAAMFILELEGDARIVVRPSGTEPKLKLYSDVREAVAMGEDPFEGYDRAKGLALRLAEALVQSIA